MAIPERKVHVEDFIEERASEQWDFEFPVRKQNFCVLSIVKNGDGETPVVKIYGCFDTHDAANTAASDMRAQCDFFDYFVADTNKWIPIPPTKEFIENIEFQEERMREVRNNHTAIRNKNAQDMLKTLERDEAEKQRKKGEETDEKTRLLKNEN